jgi:glycosyltransferase involved in cell wall biosynthesis
MSFSDISILVPTYNRSKFLPLLIMNLKSQKYPHDKLKLIIDDDGTEKFINDLDEVKRILHPIKVTYIDNKPRRTIGKKRDDLIKACDTKIFCFLDDDDIYLPTYISHSYETLKEKKVGCVGCDKMIFVMTDKDYELHAIDCGDRVSLIHEATLMMTKKFYRASCGFGNNSQGEGKNLFYGMENNVAITDIMKLMCCVQHSGNTVDKLQFAKDETKLTMTLSDEIINVLKKII